MSKTSGAFFGEDIWLQCMYFVLGSKE